MRRIRSLDQADRLTVVAITLIIVMMAVVFCVDVSDGQIDDPGDCEYRTQIIWINGQPQIIVLHDDLCPNHGDTTGEQRQSPMRGEDE